MSVDVNNMTDAEFEEFMRTAEDGPDEVVEVESADDSISEDTTEESVDTEDEDDSSLEQSEEASDDESEQPDADSDEEQIDDENSEDEESDDDTEEESEVDESTDETSDEQPAEVNTEDKPETQTYRVRADGEDFELTVDELVKLAPKAFNYVKKTQEIAPWRKTISALKEANIGHDDVNLMISALQGDKGAIAEVFKKNKLDPLELDTENTSYVPKEFGKSETELDLQEVLNGISKDPEYTKTQSVLSSEWDDASWNTLVESVKDPSKRLRNGQTYIEGLHTDIKTGMYDKVAPVMKKLKMFDGAQKSDFDYYIEASKVVMQELSKPQQENKLVDEDKIKTVKRQTEQRQAVKSNSKKRKAATLVKSSAGKKDVIDYLDDMNDADFEKEMQKILNSK